MRRRGQGSMFRRPGTQCWTVQYYANGKRIREGTHTANRNEAVKILNQGLAAVAQGKPVGPDVERTTLADIFLILVDNYRANGRKSIGRVEDGLRHLREYFGDDSKARAITGDRVNAYIGHRLAQKAKPATVNRELAALRRAFNLALDAGRVAIKPKIVLLTERNVRTGFIEPAQLQALLDESPKYLQPLYETAYATGWRIASELLPLTWDRVDFKSGWIRLEAGTTKNGRGREFPLIEGLRTIFEAQYRSASEIEQRTGRSVRRVFFHPDGTPILKFRTAWRGACRRASLTGLIPHDFRRCAARNLLRAGIPQSIAMRLLGHETPEIFRRYAIVDSEMLHEAGQKLQSYNAKLDRSHPMTLGEVERLALSAEKFSPSLAPVQASPVS